MDLPDEAVRLLNDRSAVKTLATTAFDGTVSLVNIRGVKAPEPNIIVLAQPGGAQFDQELLRHMETSTLVSILCVSASREREIAYQIICSVTEFQTAGPLYEKFLDELRARTVDLKGVWVLEPADVVDRSFFNFDAETRTI
ncbi:MAG: hypothetical protein ABSD89_08580 [Halobacteriota archaeon]|jgi:hypothetical protein